jgi:hypothetical protein
MPWPRPSVVACGFALGAFAAGDSRADDTPSPSPPPGLAAKHRLSDEDYARKEDGGYFTGVPLFAYDPNFGYGFGARVYYYYDGHRGDPLFAYTPYLHRVFAQVFASTGGAQDHLIDYDAPAFPDAFARRSSSRRPRTGRTSASAHAAWRRSRSRAASPGRRSRN